MEYMNNINYLKTLSQLGSGSNLANNGPMSTNCAYAQENQSYPVVEGSNYHENGHLSAFIYQLMSNLNNQQVNNGQNEKNDPKAFTNCCNHRYELESLRQNLFHFLINLMPQFVYLFNIDPSSIENTTQIDKLIYYLIKNNANNTTVPKRS